MGTAAPARKGKGQRKASAKRERAFSALANRQHSVISRRQLISGGLGVRTISRRVEVGQLHQIHRGVYVFGDGRIDKRGEWMAAVLACGERALLSHRSAGALWGLMRSLKGQAEVTSATGRQRPGIAVHEGGMSIEDRTVVEHIPVTTVARTLFDLAEVLDEDGLWRAAEEADRLRLFRAPELEAVCARCPGRRALRPIRRLIDAVRVPEDTQSPLEDRVLELCRKHDLPMPVTGATVLGHEVDAFWPARKLTVEADSWKFHGHREAFERDRTRDAAMQVEGYRVIRLTHRRLEREPAAVADQLRLLLQPPGEGRAGGERGQGTVEWVGLVAVVSLLLVGLLAAGVRVPGAELGRALASRLLCAAALADRCGDEPVLIAAYGSEVGELVRRHMPTILFEAGSRALPVDFRRCRSSACGDGSARGLAHETDAGLPVTAFVHVIDCRDAGGAGADATGGPLGASLATSDCSGERAGNLYIQYWMYYADSATLRGVPIADGGGYHRDDWEAVQFRIGPDGHVDQRASSHHGYNHTLSVANWGSDAGIDPLEDAAEAIGARPPNGWGAETRLLVVSGGSHAGNAGGFLRIDRVTPGRRVHLVPLETLTATGHAFAIEPPWRKRVWRDPEADGTD